MFLLPKTCPACKHRTLEYSSTQVTCGNCPIYTKGLPLYLRPLGWATTKRGWWWRAAVAVWFAAMLIQNWANPDFALHRLSNPFSALDMGIHELGHLLFMPFGQFMSIAGGSIFQCVFPLLWLAGFLQKRFYFAASLCLCWLGLNVFDVATYAGDAKALLLPLAGGPGSIGLEATEENIASAHDWHQLLTRTGNLESAEEIAEFLRIMASSLYILGLILAGVLVAYMLAGSIRAWIEKRARTGA